MTVMSFASGLHISLDAAKSLAEVLMLVCFPAVVRTIAGTCQACLQLSSSTRYSSSSNLLLL